MVTAWRCHPRSTVDVQQVTILARAVVAGSFGEETLALLDPGFSASSCPAGRMSGSSARASATAS